MLLDQAQGFFRVVGVEQHRGATLATRCGGRGRPRTVMDRQADQHDSALGVWGHGPDGGAVGEEAVEVGDGLEIERRHALGQPGRARRVEHHVGPERPEPFDRVAVRNEILEPDAGGVSWLPDRDQQPEILLGPSRRVDVVAREPLGLTVGDDVHRLVGRQLPVHGDLGHPKLLQRPLDHEPRESETEAHPDPLPRDQPHAGQRVGDPVGLVVPVAIGQRPIAVDHGDGVGTFARPELE